MSEVELWTKIENLASELRTSRFIQRQGALLSMPPSSADFSKPGIAGVRARNVGVLDRHPLLLASSLRILPSVDPIMKVEPDVVDMARRVERATRRSLAWIRSRLPGYPIIPVPQLMPHTEFTTGEFTWRVPWELGLLGAGIQLSGPDDRIAADLEVANVPGLRAALEEVANALTKQPEWVAWADAYRRSRESKVKHELTDVRRRLREVLTPETLNAHEPHLAVPRLAFRRDVLRSLVDTLSPEARAVCDLFVAVDDLIELTCIRVLGYLALFGRPRVLGDATSIKVDRGRNAAIDFESTWPLINTGDLWFLEDPLVRECILISRLSFSFQHGETRIEAGGQRLDGSSLLGAGLR